MSNASFIKEVEDADRESGFKEPAGEKKVEVAAGEMVEKEKVEVDEAAAKKAEGYRRMLVELTQERDRWRQEEEERKRAESRRETP